MAFDFPSSPSDGATYTPAGGPTYTYTGGVWRVLPPSQLATSTAICSDTPPANPVPGQIWWKSDTGETFIWYVDANSSQWVQQSDASLPDAPSDGGFFVRQNGAWVPVPRYQRFSLAGKGYQDVPVPVNASRARITANCYQNNATANYLLIQLSFSAGVFDAATASYNTNGYYHSTQVNSTTVAVMNGQTTFNGMLIGNSHDNTAGPTMVMGQLTVRRPRTSSIFTFSGQVFNVYGPNGVISNSMYDYMTAAAAGSALQVLAFRFMNNVVNIWDAESYLDVEWM